MTTVDDLRLHFSAGELPPTVDTRTAADWLGVGYETLLDAAKAGQSPVAPIRVGRTYRWPTVTLLSVLGLGEE